MPHELATFVRPDDFRRPEPSLSNSVSRSTSYTIVYSVFQYALIYTAAILLANVRYEFI